MLLGNMTAGLKSWARQILGDWHEFSRLFPICCFYFWCRNHRLLSLSNQWKTTMLPWACSWWDFLGQRAASRLLVRSGSAVQPRWGHAVTLFPSPTLFIWREEQSSRDPVWWGPAVYKDDLRSSRFSSWKPKVSRGCSEDTPKMRYVWMITTGRVFEVAH